MRSDLSCCVVCLRGFNMNGKSFRLRMCKASWHKPPGTQFHKVWIQGGRMFLHHLLLRLGLPHAISIKSIHVCGRTYVGNVQGLVILLQATANRHACANHRAFLRARDANVQLRAVINDQCTPLSNGGSMQVHSRSAQFQLLSSGVRATRHW